jgi:glucose uptake protein GlcU
MAQKIVSTLLFILGILAVIMIIVGGIRYVTSAGDASRVKAAKDTVMYSVVGLVVAILAYAIVTFVVGRF